MGSVKRISAIADSHLRWRLNHIQAWRLRLCYISTSFAIALNSYFRNRPGPAGIIFNFLWSSLKKAILKFTVDNPTRDHHHQQPKCLKSPSNQTNRGQLLSTSSMRFVVPNSSAAVFNAVNACRTTVAFLFLYFGCVPFTSEGALSFRQPVQPTTYSAIYCRPLIYPMICRYKYGFYQTNWIVAN